MAVSQSDTLQALRRDLTEQRSEQYRQYYRLENHYAALEQLLRDEMAMRDARIESLESLLSEMHQQMAEQNRLLCLLLHQTNANASQAVVVEAETGKVARKPKPGKRAVVYSDPGAVSASPLKLPEMSAPYPGLADLVMSAAHAGNQGEGDAGKDEPTDKFDRDQLRREHAEMHGKRRGLLALLRR